MLISQQRLVHTPVMSLQTGAELARTKSILIDPRDLTVVAYELEGPMLDEHPSFLRPADVRELSNLGFIVDSSDEFVGLDDVIKIRQVYDFAFDLINLDVFDDKKHKLGKVQRYNLDSGSFSVEQLVVKRPLLRSLSDTELLISRSQILEVNDERIVVRSTATKEEPLRETLREYANPFRSTAPQPEAISHD
jgi:uncharacterized protein YrrD